MKNYAQSILHREAQAIIDACEFINDDFVKIAEKIAEIKGNLLFVGVGKSGIIGKKFAASFASCGIKSFFIHASELMHGDLGNIDENDICVLLSFSGKSEEILKIIPFLQARKCQIFSMSQSNSKLAKLCESNITLGCVEAIDDVPAPSSSTTQQLALGDALLALVCKITGFNETKFANNHPGGALGRRFYVKVKDLMHTQKLPLISQNANIKEAIEAMSASSFGCVLLLDKEQKLCAFLSDGDLRRALADEDFSLNKRAFIYASKRPKTIDSSSLAHYAFAKMKEEKISVLVVLEEQKIAGILQLLDEK